MSVGRACVGVEPVARMRSSCPRRSSRLILGGRSTVGHGALDAVIGVRIPASQPLRSREFSCVLVIFKERRLLSAQCQVRVSDSSGFASLPIMRRAECHFRVTSDRESISTNGLLFQLGVCVRYEPRTSIPVRRTNKRMTRRSCIFRGRDDRKITGEHVFGHSAIRTLFPEGSRDPSLL
jgi:hypothetical protein